MSEGAAPGGEVMGETSQETLEKWMLTEMPPRKVREAIRAVLANHERAAAAYDALDLKLNAAEAEVERLEGLILDWDRNDYMSGPLLAEAKRIRAQREPELKYKSERDAYAACRAQREDKPEVWRCEGCGEMFEEPRTSHGRAAHAPGCDGSCQSCPVEVECGPITALREGGWPRRADE